MKDRDLDNRTGASTAKGDFVRLIRRLLGYARDRRQMIVLALLSMVVHALCRNYPILAIRDLMDEVIFAEQGSMEALVRLSLLLLLAAALGSATYFANEYFFKWLATHVVVRMREDLMRHLMNLPLRFFHQRRMGHLVSRLTNDVQVAFRAVNIFLSEIILLPIMAGIGLVFAVMVSWKLSLALLVVLPLTVLPVLHFGKKLRKRTRKGLESLADTTEVMLQTINGMRIVKAFRAEEAELDRFARANDEYLRRTLKAVKTKAAGRGLMDFVYHAAVAALVLGGGALSINRTFGITPAEVAAFVFALASNYRPVKRLTAAYTNLQESLAGAARIFEILDTEVADENRIAGEPIDAIREGIRVEDVTFRYEPDLPPVLTGVSFEIRRGRTVALVGRSGAGKSTLADLVAGFYRPDEGRILVDGRNLWSLDRASWLDRIAIVSQHPFIFNASIRENIAYGRPHATEEEIRAAASAALLEDVIANLPDGLDTIVGERGARLSGGERQRLTIARAILKQADLLILDEATSSLDSRSERLVQEALRTLTEGRTTLVIAHRLATVRSADVIVVIEDGRIVELGDHASLLAGGGVYSELYALQLAGPE